MINSVLNELRKDIDISIYNEVATKFKGYNYAKDDLEQALKNWIFCELNTDLLFDIFQIEIDNAEDKTKQIDINAMVFDFIRNLALRRLGINSYDFVCMRSPLCRVIANNADTVFSVCNDAHRYLVVNARFDKEDVPKILQWFFWRINFSYKS